MCYQKKQKCGGIKGEIMDEQLTWEEIKERYPHCNVGLKDVIYADNSNYIKQARVVCTDKDTTRDEMAMAAISGDIVMRYTTLDEDIEVDINEQAQKRAEDLEASFGKYKISDFHQGDFVKFYWKWGENKGIHEGKVFVVNSFETCSTIEVICEGVLYKNLDIYYVIQK